MLNTIDIVSNEIKIFKNFEIKIDRFGFGIPGEDTLLKGELKKFLVNPIHNITPSSCDHLVKCENR